jgi:hypothetical protein
MLDDRGSVPGTNNVFPFRGVRVSSGTKPLANPASSGDHFPGI